MGRSSVAASARTTMTSCWRESAPSSYPRTPTAGISTCASTARSCTRASDSAWSARWRGSAASRTSARRSRFPAPCTSCGRRSAHLHLVPQPVQVRQTGASEIEPALLGEPFDGLEAARELVVRALERGAWVDGELAGKVHDREQDIADLVFDRFPFPVSRFPLDLRDLLFHLVHRPRRIRPVEFFFSSRRRHTRFDCDWSSDVCSSD